MRRRLIAGVAALAMGLGGVALNAAPAQAVSRTAYLTCTFKATGHRADVNIRNGSLRGLCTQRLPGWYAKVRGVERNPSNVQKHWRLG